MKRVASTIIRRFSRDIFEETDEDHPNKSRRSDTNAIDTLPEELLLEILSLVYHDADQGAFASCLLCCRRWKRLGEPMLYKDPVIYSGSRELDPVDIDRRTVKDFLAARFASFEQATREHAQYVTSLTFRTGSCNFDWPRWRLRDQFSRRRSVRTHWLTSADRILPQLTCLTTFCLKVGDTVQSILWSPQDRIEGILNALPPSVVNLEVDVMGADFVTAESSTDSGHLCRAIHKRLRQVRVLRLRLRILCGELFESVEERQAGLRDNFEAATEPSSSVMAPPTLETCALNLTSRIGSFGSQSSILESRLCDTYARPQPGEAFNHFSTVLRQLCVDEKLPNLVNCKIIDKLPDTTDGISHGYEIYDPITDEVKELSFASAQESGLVVSDACAQSGHHPMEGPAFGSDGSITNLRLDQHAEGESTWCENQRGSRFPICQG